MNIHRSASIHAGQSGTTLRSKQRAPRSLIDQVINVGQRRVLAPHGSAKLLANSLSVDGNGTRRVDVDASMLAKVG